MTVPHSIDQLAVELLAKDAYEQTHTTGGRWDTADRERRDAYMLAALNAQAVSEVARALDRSSAVAERHTRFMCVMLLCLAGTLVGATLVLFGLMAG